MREGCRRYRAVRLMGRRARLLRRLKLIVQPADDLFRQRIEFRPIDMAKPSRAALGGFLIWPSPRGRLSRASFDLPGENPLARVLIGWSAGPEHACNNSPRTGDSLRRPRHVSSQKTWAVAPTAAAILLRGHCGRWKVGF